MHAIYVRKCDIPGTDTTAPLAVEIADEPAARTLARRVAESFPFHGRCWFTRAYWFHNGEGRHEIWSAPERSGREIAPPAPRSLHSRIKALLGT